MANLIALWNVVGASAIKNYCGLCNWQSNIKMKIGFFYGGTYLMAVVKERFDDVNDYIWGIITRHFVTKHVHGAKKLRTFFEKFKKEINY